MLLLPLARQMCVCCTTIVKTILTSRASPMAKIVTPTTGTSNDRCTLIFFNTNFNATIRHGGHDWQNPQHTHVHQTLQTSFDRSFRPTFTMRSISTLMVKRVNAGQRTSNAKDKWDHQFSCMSILNFTNRYLKGLSIAVQLPRT